MCVCVIVLLYSCFRCFTKFLSLSSLSLSLSISLSLAFSISFVSLSYWSWSVPFFCGCSIICSCTLLIHSI